ncbi:hypothetical protein RND71_008329 [Anisodus tanguticus]|uniref:SKP1 component POZ domain-containing protein n=1 Tax=Anisodus tanguticus TaxID=243964 RepID=A0AAE1SN18_9SOLA|nr:hypothetical protein RND71_008329 [Anisodus tanguticus]
MLILKTSDNKKFYLEESLDFKSELIKNIVKNEDMSIISLPIKVQREALVTNINYLKKHAEIIASDNEFKNFTKEHMMNVGLSELCDISVSVNYLKIKDLVDIYV